MLVKKKKKKAKPKTLALRFGSFINEILETFVTDECGLAR